MPGFTVAELAAFCGGNVEGCETDRLITGANTLEAASADQLSYAASPKAFAAAASSKAGCLLVPSEFPFQEGQCIIRVRNPRIAFASLLPKIYPQRVPAPSIHPSALIASSATIGSDCFIGAYVTIGDQSRIGARCRIEAGSRIGANVLVGDDSVLHPNVTLYDNITVGARAILHSGCVLGADGFGFTMAGDHYEKFPQVGTVRIGDDVEIGANSCIDRAALGVTSIGNGTKLDNLVHIGHNCTIGRHVVIAAQTGLSGSVTVGDYAALGGQTGVGEKAHIESKAIVGGKAGILTSAKVAAGEPVWGIPARPLRQHLKGLAHVAKLDKTNAELRSLRDRLEKLEQRS